MKKLLVSFLLGLTLLFSFAPYLSAVKAQSWFSQPLTEWYTKVYDQNVSPPNEIFGERYTAAQVQWVIYGLFSFFLNMIPGNPDLFLCLTNGDGNKCLTSLPKGLKDVIHPVSEITPNQSLASTFIHTVTSSQLSGVGYVSRLVQKISPVTTVKAADSGVGFTAIGSIANLWRIARNVSYSLLIVAIIVMAFMIMFRVKISPQVVITVQSALPKLITTLILVTFSFAIAGLVIDLMYVVIALFAAMIASGAGNLSTDSASVLFNSFVNEFDAFGIIYAYWVHFVASSFTSIFNSGKNVLLGIVILIFSVLSILAMLWWSIKIIWVMVKNFALTMITIIIGPIEIMMGAVTERMGFGPWLKQLISYIAVYPTLVVMMFFSFFFLRQGMSNPGGTSGIPFNPVTNVIGTNTWNPPFSIGTGIGGTEVMWVLVSFFIFSQISKVCELVSSFINGKPFDYGTGIGEVTDKATWAWGQTGAPYLKNAQEVYNTARLSKWREKLTEKFNNKKGPGPGEK